MRVFRFDPDVAYDVSRYDSRGLAIGRVGRFSGDLQVGCFYIEAGGVVGYHEATVHQLFMVLSGEGWVRGEEEQPTPIGPGQAAFWETGEWHESGSETAMVAIVLEGDGLTPEQYMPELSPEDRRTSP